MANAKLAKLPAKDAPLVQPEVSALETSGCGLSPSIACQAREGIRLMRAFVGIADVAARARLIAEAERMAGAGSAA